MQPNMQAKSSSPCLYWQQSEVLSVVCIHLLTSMFRVWGSGASWSSAEALMHPYLMAHALQHQMTLKHLQGQISEFGLETCQGAEHRRA